MPKDAIPICLIVGFLGSGKTTLLRHIIQCHSDKRLAFIVNEFSSLDVDGVILNREHEKVVCLAGGSVFCKCLSGQFIQTLKGLPQALHIPHCDGVIVEASGIADPAVAGKMLYESGLDAIYRLAQIVTVVDPGNLSHLLEKLPNTKSQLLSADTILLNKQDLYSREEMEKAERIIREINPQAVQIRTDHCTADIHLFESATNLAPGGQYAPCADPNFCTITAETRFVVDIDRLVRAINTCNNMVYRAKGFLRSTDGPVYLDWTLSTCTRFDLPEYKGRFGFVLIGAGDKKAAVQSLASKLESGVFSPELP